MPRVKPINEVKPYRPTAGEADAYPPARSGADPPDTRYLRLRDLQREIEEGPNVMESSNGANSVIAYGKGGEIASNRCGEQEMFVLCLRILQSALAYVNTLMLQDILGEPEWADLLTPADRRGLTPAVLVPRPPVRGGEPRHGYPPEPDCGHRAGPPNTNGHRRTAAGRASTNSHTRPLMRSWRSSLERVLR
ncbi:Tn3 family transposase [Streptomyces sp. NPDC001832]|uniref:Tn3 family transposase n=1 Tax=Streptomyces sp. NPDC001832 TaxID=3154527 RepID=UPI0033253750